MTMLDVSVFLHHVDRTYILTKGCLYDEENLLSVFLHHVDRTYIITIGYLYDEVDLA